jgi:hypothetical protein
LAWKIEHSNREETSGTIKGCQTVCFHTKNKPWDRKFWLFYGHLVFQFQFGYSWYRHMVFLLPIWVYFPHFGKLSQEKSGNTGLISRQKCLLLGVEKSKKKKFFCGSNFFCCSFVMRTKQAAFWPKLSRPSLLSRFFLFSNFY